MAGPDVDARFADSASPEADEGDKGGTAEGVVPRESMYSYSHFVERFKHPSAQAVVNEIRDFVNEFPANLTRLQAAQRIHHFLGQVTPKLLQAEAFSNEEDAEVASEGLEKFVVLKLFKLLFRHDPADIREDERADRALREAKAAKSGNSSSQPAQAMQAAQQVVAKFTLKQRESFEAAALELRKVEHFRAPRDKLSCFTNAIALLENLVLEGVFQGSNESFNESSWSKLLAALILKASPPNLYSNLEFTTSFRQPRMTPQEGKCLSDLANAFVMLVGNSRRLMSLGLSGPGSESPGGRELPLWLMDAGVTFNFEDRSAPDLLFGEVEELLDEYQKMICALRDLAKDDKSRTFDT